MQRNHWIGLDYGTTFKSVRLRTLTGWGRAPGWPGWSAGWAAASGGLGPEGQVESGLRGWGSGVRRPWPVARGPYGEARTLFGPSANGPSQSFMTQTQTHPLHIHPPILPPRSLLISITTPHTHAHPLSHPSPPRPQCDSTPLFVGSRLRPLPLPPHPPLLSDTTPALARSW